MAPSHTKKTKQAKITDVLGPVTSDSPGLNMGSLPAKRGQSSTDQDSVTKKSKARERICMTTSEDIFETGDESRGTSRTIGTRRPLTSSQVSNTGHHVLGTPRSAKASVGDTGSLPSKILGPRSSLAGKIGKKEKKKENAMRDISSYFNSCATSGSGEKGENASVDADAACDGSDEFEDLDMESFTEDIQSLEKQAVECSAAGAVEGKLDEFESEVEDISEDFRLLEDEAKLRLVSVVDSSKSAEDETPGDEAEEDRVDGHISDVEDDGMELLIDEEFVQNEASAGNTSGMELKGSTGNSGHELNISAVEQKFFDRVSIICNRMCEFAQMEKKYDSNKSPFAVRVWTWLRKAKPEELAERVFVRVTPEARVLLSADSIDVKSLLELPIPQLKNLRDSCNRPGVYVFVCHPKGEGDSPTGTQEAFDDSLIGTYTGQSVAKPVESGREGMSRRFGQHAAEMKKSIPELAKKAQKYSVNIPLLYSTVIEGDLVASPRVIATLPRDEDMCPLAMLIETVIMLLPGSVSAESSHGLPSQDLVADIQHCLEGSLKYQPRPLNRALPARQGFRADVRVARQCANCEHNSSNYAVGFFTSQFTQETLCRRCLRSEIFERMRPELKEMGRSATRKIPKEERPLCENPSCKKKGPVSSWSGQHDDYLLCKPCKRIEVDEFENSIFQSEYGTEGPPENGNLFCSGSAGSLCTDPRQRHKKTVLWTRSLVELAAGKEVWLCQSCQNRERNSARGKKAHADLLALRESGVVVPGLPTMAIPDEKKYCHNTDCPKLRKTGETKRLERSDRPGWALDPSHPQWILCGPCKESEKKRLVREILARRGIDVDNRRLRINEKDKCCTEEGCQDPLQEEIKARMQAGERSETGHIWFRHPVEKEGRVVCDACKKSILQKLFTEANRRARERINNPVLTRKKQ